MTLDLLLGGLGKTALVTLRQHDQDITLCTLADIKKMQNMTLLLMHLIFLHSLYL